MRKPELNKQRAISLWKLEHGYAESDSSNSPTREELMAMLLNKERLQEELSREYFETFGHNYEGDILEDVVMDRAARKALELLIMN